MDELLIVPLFALANAGIAIDGGFLRAGLHARRSRSASCSATPRASRSGILGSAWLVTRLERRPAPSAGRVGGGRRRRHDRRHRLHGRAAVATLAFDGPQLEEAKLGILSAALTAAAPHLAASSAPTALLPRRLRLRALLGTAEPLVDLDIDVDPERDHVRGPVAAPVTVVEYGDFECPYCGQAEPAVRDLLRDFGDVRYVWRHLPLTDVHPQAQLAAEAAEAAADQGAFWEMHDLLLGRQDALRLGDLVGYADELGLDVDRFAESLRTHAGAPRVADDVDSADLSGVSGTPTFFVNGHRHYGAYDLATLSAAVRAAGARAVLAAT